MVRIRRADDSQRVYSTESGRETPPRQAGDRRGRQARSQVPPDDGVVRVSRTSSGRGGKTVTLVTGIPSGDCQQIGKRLKKLCGTGGTVKDGVIEIQGDHRERIVHELSGAYTVKLAGG